MSKRTFNGTLKKNKPFTAKEIVERRAEFWRRLKTEKSPKNYWVTRLEKILKGKKNEENNY